MSIGAVSASNPVTINGLSSAQSQPQAKANQATASATATAASNVAAALKEATETAAQTAQEAGHGDRQAQLRLISIRQQFGKGDRRPFKEYANTIVLYGKPLCEPALIF